MAHWLLKTEPDAYSWDDLTRDKKAVWDGVSNALALKHIRQMKKGDSAIIYHTGNQKAAVGIAEITKAPYPDPNESDDKLVVVEIKPKRTLSKPVPLSDMRKESTLAGWDLLRIGRLSVVPVPEPVWKKILEMADSKEPT